MIPVASPNSVASVPVMTRCPPFDTNSRRDELFFVAKDTYIRENENLASKSRNGTRRNDLNFQMFL